MAKDIDKILSRPVRELREYVQGLGNQIPDEFIMALSTDSRKTARQLFEHLKNRKLRDLGEKKRLQKLLRFEKKLYRNGYRLIAGVDEAGVAPLAGPVVAAAVILPEQYMLEGLNDSKKIMKTGTREILAGKIKEDAVGWAIGVAEVEEIDRLNIYRAGLLAMQRAVKGLDTPPDYVLVDARTIPHCTIPQKSIVRGDSLSASIAAASIIAKTTRDSYMIEMDQAYSGYGFASHKGYPTLQHLEALKRLGPLPIHRTSFAPVREALQLDPQQRSLFPESGSGA